jgi:hypothetical protein
LRKLSGIGYFAYARYKGNSLADRVIQFPVQNAFAPRRSSDSLARNPSSHARRLVVQVESELAHGARHLTFSRHRSSRSGSARSSQFESARHLGVLTMPRRHRSSRFRRTLVAARFTVRAIVLSLLNRA